MLRARAVLDLADALDTELGERGGHRLLRDVELPLVGVLAGMERAGIAADTEHLPTWSREFGGAVKAAADDAYAVIGREFNLGSPKQLQVVLFDELGMPKTKTHQDRLHDRRRRAADAVRADRAPVPGAPAPPPRRDPAQGRPSTGCSRRSPTTAASTRRSTR